MLSLTLLPRPPILLPTPPTCAHPPRPQVTEGLPIEYLRHYRSGGYDFGTLVRSCCWAAMQLAAWVCPVVQHPKGCRTAIDWPPRCPSLLQAEEQGKAPVGGPGFGHPGSTRSPSS